MGWFNAAGALGFRNWVWLAFGALAILFLIGAIKIVDNAFEDTLEVARDAGATEAVAAGHEITLDQMGDANDASMEIRRGTGDRKYRQCLQDAAVGYESSCERYRPDQPLPD